MTMVTKNLMHTFGIICNPGTGISKEIYIFWICFNASDVLFHTLTFSYIHQIKERSDRMNMTQILYWHVSYWWKLMKGKKNQKKSSLKYKHWH